MGQRGAWAANHVAGSKEPSKPSGGDVSPPQQGEQQSPPAAGRPVKADRESRIEDYVAGRIANRAGGFAGFRKVGMISAVLSTLGLSLLRKRGKAGAGATLLAVAAGLSVLKRDD
jgi:hypothetical protein